MTAPAGPRRRVRLSLIVALTATLAVLCCGGSVSAYFLGDLGAAPATPMLASAGCGEGGLIDVGGELPTYRDLDPTQMRHAATIVRVGADLKVPPRGWVIAVATAMTESSLQNLPHLGKRNDHDSEGLFQQRPRMGWGTSAQVRDPVYASRKFYERLVRIRDWQELPLTVAAQRVQRSAFPDRYAKYEPLATEVVNLLTHGAARSVGTYPDLSCAADGAIAASGWTPPVLAPIVSGFRTAGRPGHDGVDLGARRGTTIRAAAAGVVTHIECDNQSNPRYDCDTDGSPDTPGCGWYLEITHAGNVITRYCHQLTAPVVRLGQLVTAGQPIGTVGTSGHSSGPHLHFEVHVHADRSEWGAVDPAGFMRDKGAPLGSAA